MKYCSNCGKEVNENAVVCVNCGAAVNKSNNGGNNVQVIDRANPCLVILSLCIPLLGLIFFLVYKSQTPNAAKGYGLAAIFGVVIGIILSVLRIINNYN